MPTIREPSYINDIIDDYLSGSGIKRLSLKYGHAYETIQKWIRLRGLLRNQREAERAKQSRKLSLTNQLRETRRQEIIDRYAKGESASKIAADLGTYHHRIIYLLEEFGVTPRNKAQAIKRSWDAGDRPPPVVSGWNKGLKNSIESREKQAATFAKTLGHIGKYEKDFLKSLRDAGYSPIPQHAVGPYNIDIAIPELAIAVEVQVGNVRSQSTSIRLDRLEYLFDRQWNIIILFTNKRVPFAVSKVSENLIATVEVIRTNPSIRGHYRVIGRAGEDRAIPGLDLNRWPIIQYPKS